MRVLFVLLILFSHKIISSQTMSKPPITLIGKCKKCTDDFDLPPCFEMDNNGDIRLVFILTLTNQLARDIYLDIVNMDNGISFNPSSYKFINSNNYIYNNCTIYEYEIAIRIPSICEPTSTLRLSANLKKDESFSNEISNSNVLQTYINPNCEIYDGIDLNTFNFIASITQCCTDEDYSGSEFKSQGQNDFVNLFPTVFNSKIQIETNLLESELLIISQDGSQLFKKHISNQKETINLESLNAGLYYVKIQNENKNFVKKEIIIKID